MLFPKKKQQRVQLSFKEKEVDIYMPMERYIMDDMGITTRSDTYKKALKYLYQTRKQAHLEMI